MTAQLTETLLRRYAIGDRTKAPRYGKDGALEIDLRRRCCMKDQQSEALDRRYVLPQIMRI